MTNIRTFVDPQGSNRVGLTMDIPDMDAVMSMIESAAGADAMAHDGDARGPILRRLRAASADLYTAAFLAAMRSRGQAIVEEEGLCGVLPRAEDPRIQLLVSGDGAHDVLAAVLPEARGGMIRILGTAARCAELVAERLSWRSEVVTPMVCGDLHTVPALTLPGGLTLQPVQRLSEDEEGGVALADAVACAMSAAPATDGPPEAFAGYLRRLPPTFRLFAAVDSDGAVRATSGHGVFSQYSTVIFVNTDPEWRGRGIGRAMTAHALRGALLAGATRAALDASDAGRAIYLRLGFEDAGTLTRFVGPLTPRRDV